MLAEIEEDSEVGARVSDEGKAFCAAVRVHGGALRTARSICPTSTKLSCEAAVRAAARRFGEPPEGGRLQPRDDDVDRCARHHRGRRPRPRSSPPPCSDRAARRCRRRSRGGSPGAGRTAGSRVPRRRARCSSSALIGLVGTALDLFTSIDLGAFRYVAWLCLVLTPVLVVFAAPWLLIGMGRRMMGRQKPHSNEREGPMALNAKQSADLDATVESEVARGDTFFLSEQYDEAEACYRAALEQATGDAELAAKLERASASRGHRPRRRGATARPVPGAVLPRAAAGRARCRTVAARPHRRSARTATGMAAVAHDASIELGHAAGAIGSFVLHQSHRVRREARHQRRRVDQLALERQGAARSGGQARADPEARPHARDAVRQQPRAPVPRRGEDRVLRHRGGAAARGRGAGAPPTAAGTTSSRDPDGRFDPMVGAAYTRFFRNVGDDRGLDAVRPRANPATDPVSVREISREIFAPKGERQLVPFLNLWAAVWIQFMNHDWISHGNPIPTAATRCRSPTTTRCGRGTASTTSRCAAPREDPTRQPADRDRPPTFINEVTHWWDGSQLYGSDRAHAGEAAQRRRRQADGHRRRPPARRPRHRHRADRVLAELVGCARRASTRSSSASTTRSATGSRPAIPTGATRRCSRPRGS